MPTEDELKGIEELQQEIPRLTKTWTRPKQT